MTVGEQLLRNHVLWRFTGRSKGKIKIVSDQVETSVAALNIKGYSRMLGTKSLT
ncbi:hypothetical protein JCM19240_4885 [Vibrio maritimus]|uniref:Uncharacterized protein n=1 Tax=Vibrio maritimus TaxID=990268 RepID=A0A090T7K7_9VIBR|nr:hypothetical protein JCM19240_4885 [Vibrio maritimus]